MPRPIFLSNPLHFIRWSIRERTSWFASVAIAVWGPAILFIAPPIRRYIGDVNAPDIPLTYPIPKGPRKTLTGYDDPPTNQQLKHPPIKPDGKEIIPKNVPLTSWW